MADPNGKKRKRDGNGNGDGASSKKKLAVAPSKITITSVVRPQLCPPVIVSSPGIRVPKNVPFTPYVKQDAASGKRRSAVSQDLVLHSSSHPTMEYTAREDGNSDLDRAMKHYVGIFDPKTGSLQLVEAKKMVVRGVPKTQQAPEEAMKAPGFQNYYALKTDLGQTFGTRKAKKAIEAVTLNAIDPNKGSRTSPRKLDMADKATLQQIGAITSTMATREELQSAVDESKPVPRPNLEAEAIQDVYDPNEFIGREVLTAVPVKDWIESTKNGEDIKLFSKHVAARVKKVADTGSVDRMRLLRYFYFLYIFWVMATPGKQRGTKRIPPRDKLKERMAPAPQVVIEHIRRKFSDGGELRKFHLDLILTHLCTLACLIDNYEFDTAMLREDLRLDQKETNTYLSEIGAKVKQVSGKEKGKVHHIAKLALPLQFPKQRIFVQKRR